MNKDNEQPDSTRGATALRDALARLWPLIDKAMRGFVFTADKAGEVAADMQTLRAAALSPPPVPTDPTEDALMAALAAAEPGPEQRRSLTFVRWKDGIDVDYPTVFFRRLARALASQPAPQPAPADSRQRFEAWRVGRDGSVGRRSTGEYDCTVTGALWIAWQAAVLDSSGSA